MQNFDRTTIHYFDLHGHQKRAMTFEKFKTIATFGTSEQIRRAYDTISEYAPLSEYNDTADNIRPLSHAAPEEDAGASHMSYERRRNGDEGEQSDDVRYPTMG